MILFVFSASPLNAHFIGSSFIHAPAVMENENLGTLTDIYLNVTTGNGNVSIKGPKVIGESTISSAQTAVAYATYYLKFNESKYNFTYTIKNAGDNVSGPSGGLAFTLLAISALTNKPLINNFTVTGTISSNGYIGLVDGIYDKSAAAKKDNMKFILVPAIYGNAFENVLYSIISNTFSITVTPVTNVSEALPYAFGNKIPASTVYSDYNNYSVYKIPYANLTCSSCNASSFNNLTQFTFNFTQNEINSINLTYASEKANLQTSLNEDEAIANKGYLYTAADMAYLTYLNAYTFANSANVNLLNTASLINNTQNYCSSFVSPTMTYANYQYIIGGEIRQSWANATLNAAMKSLNQTDTTDDILNIRYSIAAAQGWCSASNQMYAIAAKMGGQPVETAAYLQSEAETKLNLAKQTGDNVYYEGALQNYNLRNYAASLYSSEYALSIYGQISTSLNYTQMKQMALVNINKSNYGDWSHQLALESLFYLDESNAISNITSSNGYIETAYSTSIISRNLANATKSIVLSFVSNSTSVSDILQVQALSENIDALENQILELRNIIFMMLGLIFLEFIGILIILLKIAGKKSRDSEIKTTNNKINSNKKAIVTIKRKKGRKR
jgi:predicted S18 family serine protease